MRIEILGGILFGIIGVVIVLIEVLKRMKCKTITTGTVIDIVRSESRDSDGHVSTTLHPVFQYNVDGGTYVKKSSYGSSSCKYYIGQEIEILYNSENPNQYYVEGSFGSIVLGSLFSICGIALIIWGMTK